MAFRFLIVALMSVTLWTIPATAKAQDAPADDPNPPWKAELSRLDTPRGSDGKPILNGMWQRSNHYTTFDRLGIGDENVGGQGSSLGLRNGGEKTQDDQGNLTVGFGGRGDGIQSFLNYEEDGGMARRAERNMPLYRPEHWDRVQWEDENGNFEDPEIVCKPLGVPRMGPPTRILQTPTELFFFYANKNLFRIIPMNAPLPPLAEWRGMSWMGRSSARWEGDTLVIESVDFDSASWLGWPGWFHSEDMRVTERFTRQGDVLTWQATVNDPTVLLEPWVMNPWYVRKNPNPNAALGEQPPCRDSSRANMVTKIRG